MSIFSTGVSGLNTAQIALEATSNNIGNVHTPGYNRELAILSENRTGDGVYVADVQRQFDAQVAEQLNAATSEATALQAYEGQIGQIDDLLADREAGLAPLMQEFFGALSDVAGAPSDPAARQGVIGAADTLSAQFRSFDQYLQDLRSGLGDRIAEQVTQINNATTQVAELNREISLARARQGEAPNALLNQRDRLVADLNERLGVELSVQDDNGHYNLSIGNGQPLVAGSRQFGLEAIDSAADPSRTVVGYRDSGGNMVELGGDAIDGGALGGLMRFREEALDPAQSQLGRLAVSLAAGFNAQHQAGTDLNGDPGQAMFAVGGPTVFGHAGNAGTADVAAVIDDPAALTAADYDLRVTDAAAGEIEVTRRDNGESFTATLDAAGELAFDGVVATVDDPAQLADGDRFRVRPTRDAAGGIENLIRDGAEIAAAQGGGTGDNSNALALQGLQDQPLVGGDASLSDAYAGLVGEVGNRTNIVQVNREAREGLQAQLRQVQQSQSGVNLDEEAANLIKYQQFYQANAKVIETGATILDSLLALRA